MPGNDPARGARDTGRTGGRIGGSGKGAGGWGGPGATQSRDPGAAGKRAGSPDAGPDTSRADNTRPGNADRLDGIKGFLGGLLGYDTYGDLRTAYNRNPNVRSNYGGVTVPNIPNASIGQILGGGILGALSPTPAGVLGGIASNVATGLNNQYGPYGRIGRGIDEAFGSTPGKIEGTANVGRGENVGRDGNTPGQADSPYAAPQPQATAQLPQATPVEEMKKRLYALGLNGVPAPLGYSYNTAKWL